MGHAYEWQACLWDESECSGPTPGTSLDALTVLKSAEARLPPLGWNWLNSLWKVTVAHAHKASRRSATVSVVFEVVAHTPSDRVPRPPGASTTPRRTCSSRPLCTPAAYCTLYVPVGLAPQPRTCARCAPFTWEGAASLAPGANVTLGSELAAFTSSHYPLYYRFTYEIEGRERPILGPAALGLWTPFAAPTVSFGWTVPAIRTPEEGLRLTPILWVADATGARSRIKQGHRYVEGVSPGNCSQLLAAVVTLRTHVTNSSTTPDVVGGALFVGQLQQAADPYPVANRSGDRPLSQPLSPGPPPAGQP